VSPTPHNQRGPFAMIISKELIKAVHKIQIKTNFLVNDLMVGRFKSAFKGQGMDFEEVREYQIGDDIKSIHWNVTAKTGHPYIKKYREERELTVLILVDMSGSTHFGTQVRSKRELAAELAAFLAYSSIKDRDTVGLFLFTDQVEKTIPPRKGSSHVYRLIKEVLSFEPRGRATNLRASIEEVIRVQKKRSVCFIISDFMNEGYGASLKHLSRRHDVIALCLVDPFELDLPKIGLLEVTDAETGQPFLLDTNSKTIRRAYQKKSADRILQLTQSFRALNIDLVTVRTNENLVEPLTRYFKRREKRMHS
jgi:uncharacterized protein (DUF58 family)